ncbi:hypothetical protein AN640_02710 [Candidatus Epulonipiscium fishelsonii]|uniref:Uncharacterized protein n=1 Tax=Candidatus Epulonipiscium fishelsonii TaxID=77094 RepID=A0ACC8X8E9_9FIRM|nr:hypothetical protein AN640_02710 [Epulopiscium sp. SCG-D08WGA-EpuloA1]OON91185.1 MAG: hypothetical protein ATN32_10650 [Epulopiscium sp. AS2M-Bin002]
MNINSKFSVLFVALISTMVGFLIAAKSTFMSHSPYVIAEYIKDNEKICPVAFMLEVNDDLLVSINPLEQIPLASTFKLTLAVEYARQVGEKMLDPHATVSIDTLGKYYLPDTDGGAHLDWLEYVKENNMLKNNEIPISEVVKGMIMFSSNANTDFLMDHLGIDNINATIRALGLNGHSEIYPMCGSLTIANFINLHEKLSEEDLEKRMIEMTDREYIDQAIAIQNLMNTNSFPPEAKNATVVLNNFDIQQIWVDRFISATAKDYMHLLELINSRTYFNDVAQDELNHVLEYAVFNPSVRENLNHFGFKNGSINGVVTDARYAEDKEGNKIEIVLMMGDLEPEDYRIRAENPLSFRGGI